MFIHPLFPQPLPLPLPHPFPNDAFLVFVRPGRDDCLIFYKWGKLIVLHTSQSCMLCCVYYRAVGSEGGGGTFPVFWQIISQPKGAYATHITLSPLNFNTFLRPCVLLYDVVVLLMGKENGVTQMYTKHTAVCWRLTTDSTKGLNE